MAVVFIASAPAHLAGLLCGHGATLDAGRRLVGFLSPKKLGFGGDQHAQRDAKLRRRWVGFQSITSGRWDPSLLQLDELLSLLELLELLSLLLQLDDESPHELVAPPPPKSPPPLLTKLAGSGVGSSRRE